VAFIPNGLLATKNEILSYGWNWRTSSYVKLVRLTRPKVTCSPSFADYRHKTNAEILWDTGH
jgi:hypothetical protein